MTLVHQGLVPATVSADGHAALEGRDVIRNHAVEGIRGLVSVAGTKYTTARGVAAAVTDLVIQALGRPPVACRTAVIPLPGGDPGGTAPGTTTASGIATAPRLDGALLPPGTIPHLLAAFGSRYAKVADLAADRPEWRTRVTEEVPVIGAELVWAARHEMALTLADAVIRRTPLGALGYPGDGAAQRAAAIVGAELGWSADRMAKEVADLKRFYVRAE